MLKNLSLFSVLALSLFFVSCTKNDPNSQIDEGSILERSYTSEELGWSMRIPEGWKLLSRNQVDYFENKGAKAISEATGDEVNIEGLKSLLHFQKDPFNIFQSTSQPYDLEYEGEWEESSEALKQLLLQTYARQGIKTTVTETRMENIAGVVFEAYDINLLNPEGVSVIRQTLYSALRNGYDFGVNLTYNTDETRDTMLNAWRQSKFE